MAGNRIGHIVRIANKLGHSLITNDVLPSVYSKLVNTCASGKDTNGFPDKISDTNVSYLGINLSWDSYNKDNNIQHYFISNTYPTTTNIDNDNDNDNESSTVVNSSKCVSDMNYYTNMNTNNNYNNIKNIFGSTPNERLKTWLEIFPVLNPNSEIYKTHNCDSIIDINSGRTEFGPGCYIYGANNPEDMYGFQYFLNAAKKFPQFVNNSDNDTNILELAAFLGNVTQETSGLLYSAELGSSCMSLYGKGSLQLTGPTNYINATLGRNNDIGLCQPPDINHPLDMKLNSKCSNDSNPNPNNSPPCWQKCANTKKLPQPPCGTGYNLCEKPWIASQDPDVAWSTAIWYWMNNPIAESSYNYYNTNISSQCCFNLDGDCKDSGASQNIAKCSHKNYPACKWPCNTNAYCSCLQKNGTAEDCNTPENCPDST